MHERKIIYSNRFNKLKENIFKYGSLVTAVWKILHSLTFKNIFSSIFLFNKDQKKNILKLQFKKFSYILNTLFFSCLSM